MKKGIIAITLILISTFTFASSDRYTDYLDRRDAICEKSSEPDECEDELNQLMQSVLFLDGAMLAKCSEEEESGSLSKECRRFASFWMGLTK
ncbi:hypothetical protein [Providencia rettgeri]|uniref:hypothetical protein n=1 Tax=Providencia rettgeri TaxID=587 RepID=UPI0034E08A5D